MDPSQLAGMSGGENAEAQAEAQQSVATKYYYYYAHAVDILRYILAKSLFCSMEWSHLFIHIHSLQYGVFGPVTNLNSATYSCV